MLRCRELVELVTDFLEETLSPEGEREVRDHLADCADCLRLVGHTTTTVALLRRLADG